MGTSQNQARPPQIDPRQGFRPTDPDHRRKDFDPDENVYDERQAPKRRGDLPEPYGDEESE